MKAFDRLQFLRAGLRGLFAPVSLGVVAIATREDGDVLLVRHTYRPGWSLPGGAVGRLESAPKAIVRELKEEVGLVRSESPTLFGFYLRRRGKHCDHIAVYTLSRIDTAFRPNLEIAEVCFAKPDAPPQGTSAGTMRRLLEFTGRAAPVEDW